MKHTLSISLALAGLALLGTQQALAQNAPPELSCKLSFSLSGWSAIVSSAHGTGVVSCNDGSKLPVVITAKGGGLTAGRTKVDEGKGDFTHVHGIREVLGRYAQGEAHAGLTKSGTAQVLTKGTVSLALAGHGEGIDLGIDVGEVTLKAAQ
jgi:hypothetical protein